MQSNDINHKIQKYIYKLKNAKSSRDADLYRMKLQEYHRMNKNIRGGADPSVDQMIQQSKDILAQKLSEKGTAAVYEKQKVDEAFKGLETKIGTTITNYNQIVEDKNALCQNTSYLTEHIGKLQPGCTTEKFDIDTEKMLSEQSFIKSVCGAQKQGEKPTEIKVEAIKAEEPKTKQGEPIEIKIETEEPK